MADRKILVVDDDKRLRELLQRYLTEQGFAVKTAENAEAMDKALTRDTFDLIVLDLILPDRDGFAIVDALRKQDPDCAMSLLVYSAQEIGSAEQVRLKLGSTEFLTKSRGSIHDFESQVIRLLSKGTAAEVMHAA